LREFSAAQGLGIEACDVTRDKPAFDGSMNGEYRTACGRESGWQGRKRGAVDASLFVERDKK
jgi:hypothetical protein